jgi:hypothetical protein
MNIRVSNNGTLKLQVSHQELEQLKYCVSKVVEKFDMIGEAATSFSQQDLEQFAKRVKTTQVAGILVPSGHNPLRIFDRGGNAVNCVGSNPSVKFVYIN